jgi:hypothetical protein
MALWSSAPQTSEAVSFSPRKLEIEMKLKNESCNGAATPCREGCSPYRGPHHRLELSNRSGVAVDRRRESTSGPRTPEREVATLLGKRGFTLSNSASSIECHQLRSTTCVERNSEDSRPSTTCHRTGSKVPLRAMLSNVPARDEKQISRFQTQILELPQSDTLSQKKLKVSSMNETSGKVLMHISSTIKHREKLLLMSFISTKAD